MELLPLRTVGHALEWAQGVRRLLMALSQGPSVSSVCSGQALFDWILDMRHESGMEGYAMLLNASHGLVLFFEELLPHDLARKFFRSTLPSMAKLALDLPRLLEQHLDYSRNIIRDSPDEFRGDVHLRVLPSQQPGLVLVTQELVASLLTCAFFCLYPSEGRVQAELPMIDFNKFFACIYEHARGRSQQHKMMCILHYFERVCGNMPQGMVSYERKVLPLQTNQPDGAVPCLPDASFWSSSEERLCKFLVMQDGTIEGHDGEALEVDFANMFLGGGALRSGCVQEEIRFMINPELILGMLFLPVMADNEAFEIFGAECYSKYTGYGSNFAFAGDYSDQRLRDRWGRRMTRIVAIDALNQAGDRQYESDMILREVNKAFCAFLDHQPCPSSCSPSENAADEEHAESFGIATGNWGCGAFGGDVEVKSMIQWLASSQARRPFIMYYTFGDYRAKRLQEIVDYIVGESWGVAELWSMLLEYGKKRNASGFFDWVHPDIRYV